MRRAVLLLSLAACADAPAPKVPWDAEAKQASPAASPPAPGTQEPEPEVAAGDVIAELQRMSALGQSTFRFAGVERALRSRFDRQKMPEDAVLAWQGLFAAIDQSIAGELSCTDQDLLRARFALEAELGQDREAYGALPPGLDAAARARAQQLSGRVKLVLPRHGAGFAWPVRPVHVNSLYGYRQDPLTPGHWSTHQGIDLAGDKGQRIVAARGGRVVDAGWREGYGLCITLQHESGLLSRYGHLSQLLVRAGDPVDQGAPIGLVGATGHATGPHLHFEIWQAGESQDPLELLPSPFASDPDD
jgi:murein DD-endopeptidase MepM/ murein hydrolase activator NlpD